MATISSGLICGETAILAFSRLMSIFSSHPPQGGFLSCGEAMHGHAGQHG
jgi:hypothetical protein